MYKFFGYVIEHEGNVSQVFLTRAKAKEACTANNIPEDSITMIYRFEKQPILERNEDEQSPSTPDADPISPSDDGS
jgi:hypothetical protein